MKQIDELSNKTLKSFIAKASPAHEKEQSKFMSGEKGLKTHPVDYEKNRNRRIALDQADSKVKTGNRYGIDHLGEKGRRNANEDVNEDAPTNSMASGAIANPNNKPLGRADKQKALIKRWMSSCKEK